MPWPLLRLSLRARLYLVCAILITVLLAPSYYTLRQLAELRDIAFDLQSRYAPTLLLIGRTETSFSDLDLELRNYIAEPSEEARADVFGTVDMIRQRVVRLAGGDFAASTDSAQLVVAALSGLAGEVDSLLQARRPREAATAYQGGRPLFEAAHLTFSDLAQAVDTEGTAEAARAERISMQTARTAAAATGLAAGLAVLLALLSVGTITSPLGKLRAAMAAVAAGRFTAPPDLPYGRGDEIGDLTRSFRSMAERLAELDRLKAEFVSIASHELKTPVNVVRGYVEMIEEGTYGEINDATAEALGYIREQTEVLRERVDQLLAMSRLEAQGLEVKLAPVALGELLEEVRRNFAGVAAQKRIVFRVQPDHSVPDVALLDRRRVRDELLGNLLGNAFKFTPTGGAIYFRAWGEPGWLILQIRDTGDGIPPAQLPYVFEKYYQAGQHAGKVGSGLGLAIAREIVEAHGGRISVESRQGAGSVFRVELPAMAQSAALDAPSIRVSGGNGERRGGNGERQGGNGGEQRDGNGGSGGGDGGDTDARLAVGDPGSVGGRIVLPLPKRN